MCHLRSLKNPALAEGSTTVVLSGCFCLALDCFFFRPLFRWLTVVWPVGAWRARGFSWGQVFLLFVSFVLDRFRGWHHHLSLSFHVLVWGASIDSTSRMPASHWAMNCMRIWGKWLRRRVLRIHCVDGASKRDFVSYIYIYTYTITYTLYCFIVISYMSEN